MPERPEIVYQVGVLRRELMEGPPQARRIAEAIVADPVVVRRLVEGQLPDLIQGRSITAIDRRAHFFVFSLDDPAGEGPLELAVHPMLAGKFSWRTPKRKITKDTGVVLRFADGRDLRYRDPRQMGKVYLLRPDQRDQVPGLGTIGVDVLDPKAFDWPVFRALAKKRRDQVKVFLLDKSVLDAMGNAYADEVMHAAKVHPKTFVRSMDEAALRRLHGAISGVLGQATATVAARAPALDEKVRDFLHVRNRKGKPCPVCGTAIRVAGVRGHDAFFCPQCQPDGRASGLVDWGKLRARRGLPPKA